MSSDSKIYVDAGQPATLNDGAQADRLHHLARGRLGMACAALSAEDTGHRQGDWRAGVHGASDRSASLRAEAAGLRHARQSRALPRNRRPDEADRRNRTCGAAPLGFDDRRFDTHSNCARAPVTAAMKSPSG